MPGSGHRKSTNVFRQKSCTGRETRHDLFQPNHGIATLTMDVPRANEQMANDEAYQQELRERDIRQKHLDAIVQSATDAVASTIATDTPSLQSHFFYGASGIHPRHLVTWYLFRTNADYAEAQSNGLTQRIDSLTRNELTRRGYPSDSVAHIHVNFATDEDIQRETGGDYWSYFK